MEEHPDSVDVGSSILTAENLAEAGCLCETCVPQGGFEMVDGEFRQTGYLRFIVCGICGNKRCPHATNHRNDCTNSNEPGQKGSSWENYKLPSVE
jgi:hypothetical protein